MDQSLNELLFKGLFDNSHIAMIISDTRGVILNLNSFATEMFEYDEGELVGQKIEVLVPRDLRESHIGRRESYNRDPKPRIMSPNNSLHALKKDNTAIQVEISLSSYKIKGELIIVSIINDISDSIQLKNDLKELNMKQERIIKERTEDLSQALSEISHKNRILNENLELKKRSQEKLEVLLEKQKEFNELKSRFISMASHEFRTPLAGIMTSASLLSRYTTTETEPKRQKHIDIIKNSVKYLTSVLNDFLSIDKIDQREIGVAPAQFKIESFINDIISKLQQINQDQYNMTYSHFGENLQVSQDREMLDVSIVNLISNSIKYSDIGSTIEISSRFENNNLVVSVKDEGIGIPAEDQKYLFNRFFRAHNAVTIQGTGLGLNIVKKYIEYMNGTISFTSKEHIGSTFEITVPKELKR